MEELGTLGRNDIEGSVNDLLLERYDAKERMIGPENMRQAERIIMLNVVDNQWKDHLLSMDHLKEGIGLRGYGQKDPLIEYKKESFDMFQDMMDRIEDETIKFLYFMRIENGMDEPPLPYPEIEEEEDEDEEVFEGDETADADLHPASAKARRLEANRVEAERQELERVEAQKREAQKSVFDLTRNIERKKDRELAGLQFTNGNGTGESQPVSNGKGPKVGRNELCPCGSGKKYKKCHGATG
jgi:preprotein translocase subunit SecA